MQVILGAVIVLLWLYYNKKQTEPKPNASPTDNPQESVQTGTNLSSRLEKDVSKFIAAISPSKSNFAETATGSFAPQDTGVPSSTMPKVAPTGFIRRRYPTQNDYHVANNFVTCNNRKTGQMRKQTPSTMGAFTSVANAPTNNTGTVN